MILNHSSALWIIKGAIISICLFHIMSTRTSLSNDFTKGINFLLNFILKYSVNNKVVLRHLV